MYTIMKHINRPHAPAVSVVDVSAAVATTVTGSSSARIQAALFGGRWSATVAATRPGSTGLNTQ